MPRNISLFLMLCLTGMLVGKIAFAQDVYVKDSLRVGVRTEPGNEATPFSVVTTGMKLEVIDRSGDYVKIKTSSGTEGWIKSTYVSEEIPAVIKFEELQVKYKELESKLTKQEKSAQASALNNKSLNSEIEQLKQVNAELRVQLEDVTQTPISSGLSYLWKLLLLVIIGTGGFALGVAWYRKKMMKRLGGLHF